MKFVDIAILFGTTVAVWLWGRKNFSQTTYFNLRFF